MVKANLNVEDLMLTKKGKFKENHLRKNKNNWRHLSSLGQSTE